MHLKTHLLLLAILLTTANTFAQTTIQATDGPEKPNLHGAQVIYGEIFGNGLLFSVNYDFRFTKSQKGLGMRLGAGFFGGSDGGIFTFPIGINHLAGKAPNYFESGLGVTYATFTGKDDLFSGSNGTLLVPSLGYRYQPEHNGFFGRIAVSPLINLEKEGG